MSSATFDYDRQTDTLYIKLRAGKSVDNEILDDGDIVVDIGADGAPLGYEIQHASTKRDFIAGQVFRRMITGRQLGDERGDRSRHRFTITIPEPLIFAPTVWVA
jgi:uncharacterized protein YuzE